METEYDLVVVGAGVYGLPVVKTYLEVHPAARVLLLDAGQSIGGTWSKERQYEYLSTNNFVGTLEYADFPMDFETFGVKPASHVPGEVMHNYLNAYVDHYGFRDRIRLRAVVRSAELLDDGAWLVRYDWEQPEKKSAEMKSVARKLVLATGTTSELHMPSIPGMDTFDGPLFHSAALGSHTEDLKSATNVLVLGGSKSAMDAVYLNASKGTHVDWVIRSTGNGPKWMAHPYVSPAKLKFETLVTIRFLSFVSPSINLDAYPTIRHFLHNTSVGRAIVRGFFNIINYDLTTAGNYNQHPETKKLLPKTSVSWAGTSVGVFNYPSDLFEYIRQGLVRVHIADPISVSPGMINLSDGTKLIADVFICATGYKHTPTIKFLPNSITSKIGILHPLPNDDMILSADREIMLRYPELKDQPEAGANGLRDREKASYALYRGIVPPAFLASGNLAYCGMSPTLRGFLTSQISALWITALFDGRLSAPLPSEAEAQWQAVLHNRFWRWRAPTGLGSKGHDIVFEIMPYVDTLLRDLGLKTARKSSWWKELFEPYGVLDYPQIVQEWMMKESTT